MLLLWQEDGVSHDSQQWLIFSVCDYKDMIWDDFTVVFAFYGKQRAACVQDPPFWTGFYDTPEIPLLYLHRLTEICFVLFLVCFNVVNHHIISYRGVFLSLTFIIGRVHTAVCVCVSEWTITKKQQKGVWQFHPASMSTINICTVAAKTSDKSIGINTLTTTTVTTETVTKTPNLDKRRGTKLVVIAISAAIFPWCICLVRSLLVNMLFFSWNSARTSHRSTAKPRQTTYKFCFCFFFLFFKEHK